MTAISIKNPSGYPKGLKDKQLEIMEVFTFGCVRRLAMRCIRFFRMIYTIFPYDLHDFSVFRNAAALGSSPATALRHTLHRSAPWSPPAPRDEALLFVLSCWLRLLFNGEATTSNGGTRLYRLLSGAGDRRLRHTGDMGHNRRYRVGACLAVRSPASEHPRTESRKLGHWSPCARGH